MYDVIIIGAGVVGSATAYYLSQYNIKTALLESNNDVACGTSKANSAIIHAGYDPKENTLMAKYNVQGSKLTKELCAKLNVSYKQNGALVLAFDEEEMQLVRTLYQRGCNNGVEGLAVLNPDEVLAMEPKLSNQIAGALYAPTSAIISPWEYTLALAETAVKNGVELFLNNQVLQISRNAEGFTVKTNQSEYQSRYIINAAGIHSDKIHELIGEKEFTITPVKGEYYLLDKAQGNIASRTIFQCPNRDGKGVLVSPTVHGNLIVGPNAQNSENDDFSTSQSGLAFVKEKAMKTTTAIDFRDNIRNFAGIRAKSDCPDFIVSESRSVENFFNLAGICSPGLSAAPALGLAVVEWLKGKTELKAKETFELVPRPTKFKNLNDEQKNEKIRDNPAYGRIICRCEMITEGDILDAFREIIPPQSFDAVKRRAHISMGRCQGGFCGEKIVMMLMKEFQLDFDQVLQGNEGSNMLMFRAKGE